MKKKCLVFFFFSHFLQDKGSKKSEGFMPGAEDHRARERHGHPTAELAENCESCKFPGKFFLLFKQYNNALIC